MIASPNPGRINKKPSQQGEREASGRQRVVSGTTTPQRRAFSSSLCRHKRYRNNKKKEKDRCGRERHRRRRRAACSGRCFYVTRHPFAIRSGLSPTTLAQKFTVTHPHEASSCAMFSWPIGVERSAPRHVRDNHRCHGQVRNQPVVMFCVRIEHNVCVEQIWTAGLPRPLGAWVSDGPHPGGYAGVRLREARHPGPAEHEGDLNPEPSAANSHKRNRRLRSRKAGLQHSWSPMGAACGHPNNATSTSNCDITVAPQCEESNEATTKASDNTSRPCCSHFFCPFTECAFQFSPRCTLCACTSHLIISDERVFFFRKKLRRVFLQFRVGEECT